MDIEEQVPEVHEGELWQEGLQRHAPGWEGGGSIQHFAALLTHSHSEIFFHVGAMSLSPYKPVLRLLQRAECDHISEDRYPDRFVLQVLG